MANKIESIKAYLNSAEFDTDCNGVRMGNVVIPLQELLGGLTRRELTNLTKALIGALSPPMTLRGESGQMYTVKNSPKSYYKKRDQLWKGETVTIKLSAVIEDTSEGGK